MKVLIVDDESIVRRALQRALELKKHEVHLASNGVEGLKLWQSEQPDLIFLDVLMPEMGGLQVLKEIGAKKSGKIILMSANSVLAELGTAEQMGADLFIPKPFGDIFDVISRAEELVWQKSS